MSFCDREHVASVLKGRSVAIVGSGPGVLGNPKRFVDSFDVVLRVNNWKLQAQTGYRTDIFYSYFGNAIRKSAEDAKASGVRLCMCKCPNGQFIESDWHRAHGKMNGVDFSYIYALRAQWWFCPTYVPPLNDFLAHFRLLGNHVPTTGFAALLDVLSFEPKSVYLTGFDFFQTGIHNLNERWRAGDPSDPIGHRPAAELEWIKSHRGEYPIQLDAAAENAMVRAWKAPSTHVRPKWKRITA